MLTIRAVTLNGQPLPQPVQADFDELGGSIGRADGNALVLPDPERYISRTQATITYGQGGFVIRDCGSAMPVMLNGRPLGKGTEARLAAGDSLQIGGYALEAVGTAPRPAQVKVAAPQDDARAVVARPDADPFGLGLPPAALPSEPHGRADAVPDPFADDTGPLRASVPAAPQIPDDLDLGPGSAPSIDQLFRLGAAPSADPLAAGGPLGEPCGAGGASMSQDPLVALGAVPEPSRTPPPQRDDAMEIHAAYIPPDVSFGAGTATAADSDGMMNSWNAGAAGAPAQGAIRSVVVPSPAGAEATSPAHEAPRPPEPLRESVAVSSAPAPAAPDELLRAFLAGAGVPDLDLRGPLAPQTMEAIGQVLRVATEGVLDLLRARALIKQEMHARVTVVVARENNPLKFSPNVEVALAQLLAPRAPGFMGPVAAFREACDDLRAHQFGVMAGMRAALEGVLRRFEPSQLERRLDEHNVLDSLLPMRREARLWTLFGELYGELTREAQDDFDSLFGQAFVRAYEAQLEQIRRGGTAGR